MATKTSIISTINGFITAIVTVTKVRSAFNTIIDNIYPTVVTDDNGSTNVFTSLHPDLTYELYIVKQGRSVTITGYIINESIEILSDDMCEITNSEYQHFAYPVGGLGAVFFYGNNIQLLNNKIKVINIGAGQNLRFNLTYFTSN